MRSLQFVIIDFEIISNDLYSVSFIGHMINKNLYKCFRSYVTMRISINNIQSHSLSMDQKCTVDDKY